MTPDRRTVYKIKAAGLREPDDILVHMRTGANVAATHSCAGAATVEYPTALGKTDTGIIESGRAQLIRNLFNAGSKVLEDGTVVAVLPPAEELPTLRQSDAFDDILSSCPDDFSCGIAREHEVLRELASSSLATEKWRELCEDAGIDSLDLGAVVSEPTTVDQPVSSQPAPV